MDCYEFPCPVNCSVSQWSNWTSCSGDCRGESFRRRNRNIEEAKYDGTCDEDLQQTENCTLSFSEWSDWSDCVTNSISAKGVKLRFRVAASSRDIKCYDTLVCHDSLLIFPTMIVVLTLLLFLTVVFVTTFIAFKKVKTGKKQASKTKRKSAVSVCSEKYDNDELEDVGQNDEKKNKMTEEYALTNDVPSDCYYSETESGVYSTYEGDDAGTKNMKQEDFKDYTLSYGKQLKKRPESI